MPYTLRMRGIEITLNLKLRNIRYHIERALCVEAVTESDRDLMDERGRARLYRATDLFTSQNDLLEADKSQAEAGCPLQQRRYRALDVDALSTLLGMAGFIGTPEARFLAFVHYFETEHSAPEVCERFAAFATPAAAKLFETLGHYGNNAKKTPGQCRWLIGNVFGTHVLISRQRRIDGQRAMFYQLDIEVLTYRIGRARRAAANRRQLPKNVNLKAKSTFLDSQPVATPCYPTPGEGCREVRLRIPIGSPPVARAGV